MMAAKIGKNAHSKPEQNRPEEIIKLICYAYILLQYQPHADSVK